MQSQRLRSPLSDLVRLLKRSPPPALAAAAPGLPPLDPVERLQHNGSTFPVVVELSRLGW